MGKNGFLKNFKGRSRLEKFVISVGVVFCLLAVLSMTSVATTLPRFIVGACMYIAVVAVIINIILKKIHTHQINIANKGTTGSLGISESGEVTKGKTKNKMIAVLVRLWYIYCFISILSVPVCIFLGGFGIRMISSSIQFPLGGVDNIAVDSMGRIYCGIPFYSRIQVYSEKGDFLKGWFVPDGVMVLEVDTNDLLHYLAFRNDTHYVFKPDGELLKEEKVNENFIDQFGPESNRQIEDTFGNIYKIEEPWLSPNVVKIDPSGKKAVLISDPFYLWFFRAPLPSWGLNALIGIIWGFLALRKKKETNHG